MTVEEKETELLRALALKDEAILKAIDMITSEYCSHTEPCGATSKDCYADFLYRALDV